MKKTAGIYSITCTATGDEYIGSTNNLQRRASQHLGSLKQGTHFNDHLQRAFDKYGIEKFCFIVLCSCEPEERIAYEQAHMDMFQPVYNLRTEAGPSGGMTDETRAKISVAQKKRLRRGMSPETKAKIAASVTGYKHTDAAKLNMSIGQKRRAATTGIPTPTAKASPKQIREWSQKGVCTQWHGKQKKNSAGLCKPCAENVL